MLLAHDHRPATAHRLRLSALIELGARLRGLAFDATAPDRVPQLLVETLGFPRARLVLEKQNGEDATVVCSTEAGVQGKEGAEPLILTRHIYPDYLLTLELAPSVPMLAAELPLDAIADAVADYVARGLLALTGWQARPEVVGEPFDHLTPREWLVCMRLMTPLAEKQVAEGLEMSRNTLHSHVKSIYRKTQCRSRLEVMAKLHAAQETYRQHAFLGEMTTLVRHRAPEAVRTPA